jgi:hypothetical protein
LGTAGAARLVLVPDQVGGQFPASPTPGVITLTATGIKSKGVAVVNLFWNGATSNNIDIYRNGVLIRTVPNIGTYTDNTGIKSRATFTYTVCAAGTQNCSNVVIVQFGG